MEITVKYQVHFGLYKARRKARVMVLIQKYVTFDVKHISIQIFHKVKGLTSGKIISRSIKDI